MQIELLGRHLDVPQAIDGVARFDFDALCRRPLGAADYLKLAQRFHTLVLDRIPVIGASERNEAKRFIILIDALYDMRVKLIASAAGEPETLYRAPTARRRSNSRAPPRVSSKCARPTISRCRTGARAGRRPAISAASRRREASAVPLERVGARVLESFACRRARWLSKGELSRCGPRQTPAGRADVAGLRCWLGRLSRATLRAVPKGDCAYARRA